MSKINSQDLFQLIKSLSKAEKRYFKLFATRHTIGQKNKYLLLFDRIDEQKEYNEKEILNKEKSLGKKQLADLKNYLYKLILKSFLSFHSGSSVLYSIKEMLRKTEILLEKGLYGQCEKLLAKARKLAYRNENYREVLEIISLEKRLLDGISFSGKTAKDLQGLHNEEVELLDKIKNSSNMWEFYARTFWFTLTEGYIRSREENIHFNKLVKNVFQKNIPANSPYETSNLFYFAHELGCYAKHDWQEMYDWCKKHLLAMDKYMPIAQEKMNPYIGLMNYLILSSTHLKKYDEALEYIKRIRSLSHRFLYTQIRIFVRSYMQELILYTTTGEFQKGIAIVPEIEKGLFKYKDKINKELRTLFYYHIFHIYFLSKDHSKALLWLNKIVNDKEISSREDIHCIARVMNIILHYEMGNEVLIQHSLRSSSKFLLKKHRLYEFEKMILSLIKKLIKTDEKEEQQQLLAAFKKGLKAASNDLSIQTALEYFNFLAWADSKIGKK